MDDYCYYGAEIIAFLDDDIYEDYGYLIRNVLEYDAHQFVYYAPSDDRHFTFKFNKRDKKVVYFKELTDEIVKEVGFDEFVYEHGHRKLFAVNYFDVKWKN